MPEVAFDEASQTWLLSTPNTGYALRLGADGILRHLYWGPPLTVEQAMRLLISGGVVAPIVGAAREGVLLPGAGVSALHAEVSAGDPPAKAPAA